MEIERFFNEAHSPVQLIEDSILSKAGIVLYIKRDDLLHPQVSGNKMRKMKYNLLEAIRQKFDCILTFGGAYSNHIYATAAAGAMFGLKTIGIIRGEEYTPLNPTLAFAKECGMQLHYINRAFYRGKNTKDFLEEIKQQFGPVYILPEGGSNEFAVKGCTEIIGEITEDYDIITSSCGTGGTMAGLVAGLNGRKKAIGFTVLKGADFLKLEIDNLIQKYNGKTHDNWNLETQFHFGGYAKYTGQLIDFINNFRQKNAIQLDPIYTGKMFYGLYQLILNGKFDRGTKIMAIHTGGLQGIEGFNQRFGPLITY